MNAPISDGLHGQPHAIVERDGVRYTLLGTAHVSQASVDAVRDAIGSGAYDAVAVELDPQRLQALTDPDALARLDLIQVLRTGKTALFAANLALAAYQRRLAEQLGIEPGAELKRAVLEARQRDLPVHLIDREVGLTFKRASSKLGWWGRAKLGGGLLAALFVDEEVGEEEIEKLKQGDMLESSFGEFASESPQLYESVIAERDRYMAARLRESHGDAREVLAVVGAGHLQGLAQHLREETRAPATVREELESLPQKSSIPWFTIILSAFVLGGFAWGFWRGGIDVGSDLLLQWVLATGVLGAIGCAVAGGHPLSILVAFVASPITPLHPALASGTLSALTEAWVRKPTYADFMALRDDVQTLRGWWRNRVARVLLNFFLTSLGTAIGVWTGGLRMLGKLIG
ncbi:MULTISPECIES: TraB/GumN family protein [unclassified Lysobacter]|uniref:TraB/GumN family protein n=1 Tax=unclassified Lysobacter TaxID=2635362 RepID=UPI0006FA8237|nr:MULTISPECIES: TraB/GumN family protein [unclassified Lysobacter]KRA20668.1 conjugal transfer protein TraB [Lysobacter sp. Root604]KRD39691.1 conjugal transfer protein TraB [Lysobacter sp. Root916]KRD79659.1 conjugal transfer protein TraB [Lysobacter sp. Root983]